MNSNEKLRQALVKIREAMIRDSGMSPTTELHTVIDRETQEALAEPLRNCDVGTTEEQMERHYIFCSRNIKCHPHSNKCMMCYANWSQKPYKEEK